jgi:hypothetical protein
MNASSDSSGPEKRAQTPQQADEALLIDLHFGECDEATAERLRSRLESEPQLRDLNENVRRALTPLDQLPEIEPPEDLVQRTLSRVQAVQQTNNLLAREEARRSWLPPSFSLREIAMAAAAVILMAVLFVPALQYARRQSSQVACRANLGQIGTALTGFANEHDGLLPASAADEPRWLGGEGAAASNSAALFSLVSNDYAEPTLFQCPAGPVESFAVSAGMNDFPAAEYVGYSYQHAVGGHQIDTEDPDLVARSDEMVILADDTPVFRDGRPCVENARNAVNSPNHGGTGQNSLHLDMHVGWDQTPLAGVDRDNIFLAGSLCDYTGTEEPVSKFDTFLLPAYTKR